MIDKQEAVRIACLWHSVITWSDPGATMYALSSTGRVQSQEHRENLLHYIDTSCLPGAANDASDSGSDHEDDGYASDVEELQALREYIVSAPVEHGNTRIWGRT